MICFPLDNTLYEAKDMGAYLCTRTRGVYSAENNLAVTPLESGLSVRVAPGVAWLQWSQYWGVVALEETAKTLTLDVADGMLNRIDAIVCRLDKIENIAQVVVKKGQFDQTPNIASPQRDENVDEIYLATVYVHAGAVSLTASDITDQRMNEDYCGLMRDGVTRIPTAQLQSQAQAMIEELQAAIEDAYAGTDTMLKSQYDPDTNGIDITVQTYTCTTSETVHALTGSGNNIKFVADAPFEEGNTFAVNGTLCAAQTQDGEALSSGYFAAGAVVSCFRNGNTLNFNQGGGAALNFRIIGGTTQPENPKENDIWVNTDVPIGEYQFTADIPANRSDGSELKNGDVYIAIRATSAVPMNILKKNRIMVYPVSVYQWNEETSKWGVVNAKTWQNGKWVDWALYYYFSGNEFENLTGGFASTPYTGGTSKITLNKTAEAMNFSTNSGAYSSGAISTRSKIDVTGLKTIKAHFTSVVCPIGYCVGLCLTSAFSDVGSGMSAQIANSSPGTFNDYTLSLDVSSVTGEYYVAIYITQGNQSTPTSGNIDTIYGEV